MYEIWKLYFETTQLIVSESKFWQSSVVTVIFDPKMYRYLPLTILHLCMKYENCTLKTTQVIVSEPKCWQSSVVTLNFDLLTLKCIGIFLLPSCIYVWNMKAVLDNYASYRIRTKVLTKFRFDLELWPFEPKMYRYLPLTILHLGMKYGSCTVKTSQVIVSKPKCWWSSVVTLNFDILTPKCIGFFLLPSCIYVWKMKAKRWKLLKLSCQNQSVDIVTLNFDLLIPKCIGIFLPPSCIYVWNMKAVRWKLLTLSCQNQSVDILTLNYELLTPKCIGIFLSPSCIYVWNMKAVR